MNALYRVGILLAAAAMLALILAPAVEGRVSEVHAGVDDGELILGGRYSVTERLDLMLECYEERGLGFGVFYDEPQRGGEFVHRPDFWKLYLYSKPLGSIYFTADEEQDEKDGSFSLHSGRFSSTGAVDGDAERTDGHIKASYDWTGMKTSAAWRFRDDSESIHNIMLKHEADIDGHFVEATLRKNEFAAGGDKLVGEGKEILWTLPFKWLRVGTGYFDEEPTGVSDSRTRVWVGKEFTDQFQSTIVGLAVGVEDFIYGQGDARYEFSVGGRVRQLWQGGYGEFGLERIERDGSTPFDFDQGDSLDYIGRAAFEKKVGSVTSTLKASYDFTDKEWQRANGIVTYDPGKITARFVADYDMNDEPDDDETTYITEIKYSDGIAIKGSSHFNYEFKALEFMASLGIPVDDDVVNASIIYDVIEEEVDEIKVSYDSAKIGIISLEYNPQRPRIMLSYRALEW